MVKTAKRCGLVLNDRVEVMTKGGTLASDVSFSNAKDARAW